MPKLKRKKAYAEETVTNFPGLSDGAAAGHAGAALIRNFCFRPDGALEKRSGFTKLKEFSDPIGDFWESAKGNFAGKFFVAGNAVYFEDATGTQRSFGTIQSSTGPFKFFSYRDFLYLADSTDIYVCNLQRECFLPVCGYAPLFGVDWNPAIGAGSIHEPLNLLYPRIRISYACPAGTTVIRFPFPALSVDGVRSNGQSLSYRFTTGDRSLTLNSSVSDCTVEVAITLNPSYSPLHASIASCNIAYAFQKKDRECLYLAGGYEGCRAFSAANVSDQMLTSCRDFYPDADPLYFKSTGSLLLGDQNHPITAFARHNGRVIAFGTLGAWSLCHADEGDTVESYFLDSCPGCVAREGAISVGEELLVVTPAGLVSLKADSIDKDHFSLTPLCQELPKTLASFDLSRAILFFDAAKGRLLFRDRGDDYEGLVYVYDRAKKTWTVWDGISASSFFGSGGSVLFCRETCLFAFDDSAFLDDGRPYQATYQSGMISFGSPEEYKRALRVFCEVLAPGEELCLEAVTETGGAGDIWECEEDLFPTHRECRVPTARFRNFFYQISFTGSGPAVLCRVGYCCNL